jgi:hypothetical protein
LVLLGFSGLSVTRLKSAIFARRRSIGFAMLRLDCTLRLRWSVSDEHEMGRTAISIKDGRVVAYSSGALWRVTPYPLTVAQNECLDHASTTTLFAGSYLSPVFQIVI